jgi:hypothetical protein
LSQVFIASMIIWKLLLKFEKTDTLILSLHIYPLLTIYKTLNIRKTNTIKKIY